MEKACGPDFADAYLCKATEDRDGLMPHTYIAWERLNRSGLAMKVLGELGITLLKPAERNPPQGPISDAEYDELSISGKIRQRRWLAHQLYMKAGPMWRGGRPLSSDEMSGEWHDLIARAKGHEREAKRLFDLLHPA